MSRKIVEVGGERYTVRRLTFEELVKLGSASSEDKEDRMVVAEVLHVCLLEPRLRLDQIAGLDDRSLVTLSAVTRKESSEREGVSLSTFPA
jgi:hypothetical protein